MEEFHEYCRDGNLEEVIRLLGIRAIVANITAGNNRAFRLASKYRHYKIMGLLLKFPAVLNYVNAYHEELQLYDEYIDLMNSLAEYPQVRESFYRERYQKTWIIEKRKEMYRRHMKVFYHHIAWKIFCIRVDKYRYNPKFLKLNGIFSDIIAKTHEPKFINVNGKA